MAHVPAPKGQTLSTAIVRSEYAELDPSNYPVRRDEFDAWLEETIRAAQEAAWTRAVRTLQRPGVDHLNPYSKL